MKKEKVLIEIGEELIQGEAEQELDRQLTDKELEEVEAEILENIYFHIRDAICEVISYNELIESSKDAGKVFPHYQVYWRNVSAYQPQFKALRAFRTEKEAVEYTRGNKIGNSENKWKIIRINSQEEVSTEKTKL